MNWTASLLRNELKKQKIAYKNRLNLLISTSTEAQNYLELEEKVKVLESNLKESEQNLANLVSTDIPNYQAEIQAKAQEITKLKSSLSKMQNQHQNTVFSLKKQNRDYWLYHQREIKRLAPELKEKVANLKEQKSQLLTTISELESQIEQKSEALERSLTKEQKHKTEITQLKTELDSQNQLLAKAQEEITKLNNKIKALQKEKKKLSEQAKAKETNLLAQIQTLNTKNTKLTKANKALQILSNHRLDLLEQEKQALILLAKKKIANKKEAKELLEQLQTSWTEEKQNLIQEHQQEIATLQDSWNLLEDNLTAKEQIITNLQETLKELCNNCESQLERIDN